MGEDGKGREDGEEEGMGRSKGASRCVGDEGREEKVRRRWRNGVAQMRGRRMKGMY
jgi:hypothetical protein